jgi:hypothetical protein
VKVTSPLAGEFAAAVMTALAVELALTAVVMFEATTEAAS